MNAFRLTPYVETDLQIIAEFMTGYSSKFVIGEENEKNLHYHIVYEGDVIKSKQIYDYFNTPKDKKGNTIYSITKVQDLEKAVQYAMKDGHYHIYGDDDWKTFCNLQFGQSFPKKKSYKDSYKNLCEQYQDGLISDRQLWKDICLLKSEYGLGVNLNKVDDLVLSNMIKKNEFLVNKLVINRKIFSLE